MMYFPIFTTVPVLRFVAGTDNEIFFSLLQNENFGEISLEMKGTFADNQLRENIMVYKVFNSEISYGEYEEINTKLFS